MIRAPFTKEQCDRLNAYQEAHVFHPFTCGNGCRRSVLVATPEGWKCPDCDYTQDWAHAEMASEQMVAMIEQHKKMFSRTEEPK
jgi:hypothetical protein